MGKVTSGEDDMSDVGRPAGVPSNYEAGTTTVIEGTENFPTKDRETGEQVFTIGDSTVKASGMKEFIKTNPKAYVDDLIKTQAEGDILNVDFEALTNQLQQAGVETATITEVLAPYYENRFSKSAEQSTENQQQIKQLTKQKIDQLLKLGLRDLNPVDGSVPPRPASQGGRNKNQDRWDNTYGATHFPDGSMK